MAGQAVDWRWRIVGVTLALHVLLIPAYRSTDFEVHRNWLAITHSLPLSKWYYEATSEWTLDYPPFFAWFEWLLAKAAALADPKMLAVSNLDYDSSSTITFQRLSVSTTGLVLAAAVLWKTRQQAQSSQGAALTFLVLCNAGLIMVDNIHFQYNSFLMGVLMWSILAVEQQQDLLAGALFAVLLNLKHLFAYLGPVYFVYLLRHYCVEVHPAQAHSSSSRPAAGQATPSKGKGASSRAQDRQHLGAFAGRLLLLGGLVVLICAAAWGPFIAMGQVPQVLRRLFPFGRGLTHSYWAPNAWALYSAADKVLAAGLARLGLLPVPPVGNMAGGIVGVAPFLVLPQVGPKATAALVLLALLPCLVCLRHNPHPSTFATAVAYANLCGFMWGYHVHEKAVITALLPLAWALASDPTPAAPGRFLLLSSAGHVGIFPLLHQLAELPVRWVLALVYYIGSLWAVPVLCQSSPGRPSAKAANGPANPNSCMSTLFPSWLSTPAQAYLVGLLLVEVYAAVGHQLLLREALPFLPLMLTSTYCALGITWVWASLCWMYVQGSWPSAAHSSSSSMRGEHMVRGRASAVKQE